MTKDGAVILYAAQRIKDLMAEVTQAQEENRVNRECLKLAIDALEAINALKWEVETKWLKMHVDSALNEIEVRLAELKPEEETG